MLKENKKKFNTYVFISCFARALIETFIPLLLYKFGFSLKEVIFYFFLYNFIELLIAYPLIKIGTKKGNRILAIIGLIGFISVQLLLNHINKSITYIIILALFYGIYRSGYWISRRYYNLKVIQNKNISKSYSVTAVVNILSMVLAGYVGAIFLDFNQTKLVTIVALIIFASSLIPLYLLKFEHESNNTNIKLNLKKTIKDMKLTNIYIVCNYELIHVINVLFNLYIFIYIKDNFQTLGLFNILMNVSIIVFSLFYGNVTNGKKNFLKVSLILSVLVFLFKVNSSGLMLIIVILLEGIILKMYELSSTKEYVTISKKFEFNNSILVYEIFSKLIRCIVLLICILFVNDLKIMIYVAIVFLSLSLLFNIKKIEKDDFEF